jgi:hypothetical protein
MKKIILAILLASPAFGLVTQYVSFEHPEGWKCELSQGVFICQSTAEPDRKEAIVLSIATIASEWDSLDHYEDYLKKPKTIQDDAGTTLTSKTTYTRRRNINGTNWIDSLQYNSELPGFWARYLATVQNKLAILITYIVSDERYSQLAPQFERMVSSLKPNKEFDLNVPSQQAGGGPLPGSTILGPAAQQNLLAARLNKKSNVAVPQNGPGSEQGGGSMLPLILGLGIIGAAAVFVMKRKKQKQMPPSQSKSPVPKNRG